MSKQNKLEQISKSRLLLGNPYAYVAGDNGELEAAPMISIQEIRGSTKPSPKYTAKQIEVIARSFQTKLWQKRKSLFGSEDVNPIAVTDVGTAFEAIGFELESKTTLGENYANDVIGYIDTTRKIAAISQKHPNTVQRFTAAHELGHALLHNANGLHRERPHSTGTTYVRPSSELEADQFASSFLMPRKILIDQFRGRFKTEKLSLSDENIYGLFGAIRKSKVPTGRDLSLHLATATRFHQNKFISLADTFGLSKSAVAIRLEQLGIA